MEASPERGSQSRQVRQRHNPDNISELTSIKELLQDVTQDTHEGRHQVVWDSYLQPAHPLDCEQSHVWMFVVLHHHPMA